MLATEAMPKLRTRAFVMDISAGLGEPGDLNLLGKMKRFMEVQDLIESKASRNSPPFVHGDVVRNLFASSEKDM